MNVRNGLLVELDFNYIFLLTVIFLFFIRVLFRLKHDMVEEIKVLDNGRSSGRENEFFNWNINDFISFNRLRIFNGDIDVEKRLGTTLGGHTGTTIIIKISSHNLLHVDAFVKRVDAINHFSDGSGVDLGESIKGEEISEVSESQEA